MKRSTSKFTASVLAVLLAITFFPAAVSEVSAASSGAALLPAAVDNLRNYLMPTTYMEQAGDGYMRVVYDGSKVLIENYDRDMNLTGKKALSLELPVWGGFFKGSDAYYLVEGRYNQDCIDNTEVIRIIKYDSSWKRIGAGSIRAVDGWEYEIRYPFDYGCISMTEVGGNIYLATAREGYVDPRYGMGHQGMMLIRMNKSSFATEIVYGDFAHSFAQYVDRNGTDIFVYELSEGGRGTKLSRFESTRTGTAYFNAFTERFNAFDYGGTHTSAWAIPCYATADDVAVSSQNVIGIGTSIDQSKYDSYDYNTPYNIYLTVTPLSDIRKEATRVIWLTSHANNGMRFKGVRLTKVNSARFLVTWEEEDSTGTLTDKNDLLSAHRLHYLFIDGSGNKVSKEFTANAAFSDCRPKVCGQNAVFCASSPGNVDFYSINTSSGAFSKKVYKTLGDNLTWNLKDKVLTISGTGMIGEGDWSHLENDIEKIVIAGTVTGIGERAFISLDGLKEVVINEGVSSIGKEAFAFNKSLEKITVPASVKSIGEDIIWTGYRWVGSGTHVTQATIYAPKGSYAEKYAKENDISFIAIAGAADTKGSMSAGASANDADKAIKNLKNDSDPKGSSFAPLMLKSARQGTTSISLSWKKVKGARKYVVYGNACGSKNRYKKLSTVTKTTYNVKKIQQKKLKKATYHKFIVVALDGNNRVVSTSKVIHVATKSSKAGNPTAVKTKAKKNAVSLKKGKTFALAAKSAGRNVKKHAAIRYETSAPKIATVSKAGKIKGIRKGKCKVYAYAQNGVCRTVKVTVK